MSATYPKPTTPLPWQHRGLDLRDDDYEYLIRAANAFPHLVAALEAIWPMSEREADMKRHALAIARGEATP